MLASVARGCLGLIQTPEMFTCRILKDIKVVNILFATDYISPLKYYMYVLLYINNSLQSCTCRPINLIGYIFQECNHAMVPYIHVACIWACQEPRGNTLATCPFTLAKILWKVPTSPHLSRLIYIGNNTCTCRNAGTIIHTVLP